MSASHTILKGIKGFKWGWYGSSIRGWGSHDIGWSWNWSDRIIPNGVLSESAYFFKGTIGCIPNRETPNSVSMEFIVFFFRDSWGLKLMTHKFPLYRAYIRISHGGTLVGVHPTIPSLLTLTYWLYLQQHRRVPCWRMVIERIAQHQKVQDLGLIKDFRKTYRQKFSWVVPKNSHASQTSKMFPWNIRMEQLPALHLISQLEARSGRNSFLDRYDWDRDHANILGNLKLEAKIQDSKKKRSFLPSNGFKCFMEQKPMGKCILFLCDLDWNKSIAISKVIRKRRWNAALHRSL